ncbi:type II toxin-antitoxin system VapC family toxin [Candidatus Woesearchaeota archaeon]|nr:type II toxin-antitoxin system VapC family toxin [Candidatus Woesearchaeota archaeon]
MSEITLDTTVLAKGIIPPRRRKRDSIYKEEFRLHTIAKSILKKVESEESVMNVPSVAIIEIAAVGARLTGRDERGVQASDYVKKHGNILYDINILDEAIQIATKTKISGFDSIFIACAKITDSVLMTDDKRMYESAVKIGVKAKLLRDMDK